MGRLAPRRPVEQDKTARALELWAQGRADRRHHGRALSRRDPQIDVTGLPANISDSLRFLARCPFGAGPLRPCLLALMRDPESDEPLGIQRIALELREGEIHKLDRMALGRTGVVKVWPAGTHAGGRRGPRDHARRRHPHPLPRRPVATGLGGGL